MEKVHTFTLLGTVNTSNLSWSANTSAVIKKAQPTASRCGSPIALRQIGRGYREWSRQHRRSQSCSNHYRQHPSCTSPVRPVTLWHTLQVHQNQNRQTQEHLLSTSHHCTEHKGALTHARTHMPTHHLRTMCNNCKTLYIFIYLFFYTNIEQLPCTFYLYFLLYSKLCEYLDAARILLYTVQ